MTDNPLEIPQAMRDLAEQNIKQAHMPLMSSSRISRPKPWAPGWARCCLKSHDRWLQGGARPCRSSVEAECRVSFRAGRQDHNQNFQEILTLQTRFAQDQIQAVAAQTQEFHKLIGDAVQNAGRPPERSLRLKSDAGRSPKTPPAFACSQAEPSPSPVISRIG